VLSDASNIQTDRLHLAPLLPEAAEELHAITDNPLITDAISFLPTPFSLYDARALIHDHFNDQDRFYGIRALHNMQLVGVIGAHLHDPIDLEIGYWVGIDFQRRGYAFEAANAFVTYLTQVFPHCRART
jgi:RimJ/RimL family protein N-acetyltransferase